MIQFFIIIFIRKNFMNSKQAQAIKTKAAKSKPVTKPKSKVKISSSIHQSLHAKLKKFVTKNSGSINGVVESAIKQYLNN